MKRTLLVLLVLLIAGGWLAGAVAARVLPTNHLPLAIACYVTGYALVTGALLRWYGTRRPSGPASPGQPSISRPRLLLAVPYAIAAIAVPVHLGLTHAVPVGDRWWLLLIMWAAFALFSYAAERVSGGSAPLLLAISAVFTVVLATAAITGLTSGFVVLALVPLAGLLLWQAAWSSVLHRFAVTPAVTALIGSVVLTWPLAVTLPLIG